LFSKYWRPQPTSIYLTGTPRKVTPNLASALLHLRDPEKSLTLWIDTVCINQEDLAEKGHQVGQMRHIYACAEKTCVWLGPSSDNSDVAMDFIANSSSINVKDPRFSGKDVPSLALSALFARTWWSRIWVVQEIFLSKNIIVKCGDKEVDFEQLTNLSRKETDLRAYYRTAAGQILGGAGQLRWTFVPPMMPFHIMFANWHNLQMAKYNVELGPLSFWMFNTTRFDSTLRRDKVYALLGLCPPTDTSALEINYDEKLKPDREVFKETTAHLLQSEDDLSVLQWGQTDKKLVDLPSWVPDLSLDTSPRFPLMMNNYMADGGYDTWALLGGLKPHKNEPKSHGAKPKFSKDLEVLTLQGLVFDTVHYSSRTTDPGFFRKSDYIYMDRNLFTSPKALDSITSTAERWESVLNQYRPNPYEADPGGRREALWRTLIVNRSRVGDKVVVAPLHFKLAFDAWMGRNPYTQQQLRSDRALSKLRYQAQEYQALMLRWMTERAFIITDRGFMGLGPSYTQPGDIVCVLRGGSVPFVLRPLEGDYYQFVGECYVHGIMNGSFARKEQSEAVKTFHLT
jgi:hypothetical protein